MKDGDDDKFLSAATGDDGQGGVHRSCAANGDGSQPAEVFHQQRGAQQGGDFAQNVRQQGDGAQLRSFILGDEDAGKGVIPETRPYGHAVRHRAVAEKKAGNGAARQCAQYGHDREKHQPGVERTETLQHIRIIADADAYAEHEAAQGVITQFAVGEVVGDEMIHAAERPYDEERNDDEASFHGFASLFLI